MTTDFELDLQQQLADSARKNELELDLDELVERGRQGVRERNRRRLVVAGAVCGIGLVAGGLALQQSAKSSPQPANPPGGSLVEVRLEGNQLANGTGQGQPTFIVRCGGAPAEVDCTTGVQIEVRSGTGGELVGPITMRGDSDHRTSVSMMSVGGGDLQRWRVVTVPGQPSWLQRVGMPGGEDPSEVGMSTPVRLGDSGVSVLLMRYERPIGNAENADILFRGEDGVFREGTGRPLPAATTHLLGEEVSVIASPDHDRFELIAGGSSAANSLSGGSSMTKTFMSESRTGTGKAWATGVLPKGAGLVRVDWAEKPARVDTTTVQAGDHTCWVSAAQDGKAAFETPTVTWRDAAGKTHTENP